MAITAPVLVATLALLAGTKTATRALTVERGAAPPRGRPFQQPAVLVVVSSATADLQPPPPPFASASRYATVAVTIAPGTAEQATLRQAMQSTLSAQQRWLATMRVSSSKTCWTQSV